MNLKDAKILITGGSSGIGKATAKMLSDAGANILITGRDETKLKKVAEEIRGNYVVADVAKIEDIEKTFEAVDKLGGLDVLINNAGIGTFGTLAEVNIIDFQEVYAVNVIGAAIMAQKAAEIFKKQSSGNIINIASTAGLKGFKGGTVYSSSKFTLRGMTQCWQEELRPHNIRVMLINPSEVTTAFARENREERENQHNKLRSEEIAIAIRSALEMDNRGFIPELTVWATNPWS